MKAKKIILREIESMIKDRKAKGVSKDDEDLLGRLLASVDPETGEKISDEQLRDELITFLIAGHETTAAMLGFVFYVLSEHPDVENKLTEEIDRVLQGRIPTFEELNQMHYLELVIKETMRMYPSVSMQTTRICVEDESLAGWKIPKGTYLEVWPWILHRSAKYWDRPEVFQPERHQTARENPFSYLPFGAGNRDCIGKRLALTESKVVISMVLQNFRLKMAPGHKMTPKLTITLRPDDLIMNIQRR